MPTLSCCFLSESRIIRQTYVKNDVNRPAAYLSSTPSRLLIPLSADWFAFSPLWSLISARRFTKRRDVTMFNRWAPSGRSWRHAAWICLCVVPLKLLWYLTLINNCKQLISSYLQIHRHGKHWIYTIVTDYSLDQRVFATWTIQCNFCDKFVILFVKLDGFYSTLFGWVLPNDKWNWGKVSKKSNTWRQESDVCSGGSRISRRKRLRPQDKGGRQSNVFFYFLKQFGSVWWCLREGGDNSSPGHP